MIKKIVSILPVFALIGTIFGGYFYIDNKYAKAEEVKSVSQRLDYKIMNDQLMAIQERIWKIEDRYKEITMPLTVKEELIHLKMQQGELIRNLEMLQKVK